MRERDAPVIAPAPAKPRKWLHRAAIAFSIVQAYNVVNHAQNIVTLSQSLQWLTGWWHYIVGAPFRWAHLDIPPYERDFIVLSMLAIGIGVRSSRRRHGSINRSVLALLELLLNHSVIGIASIFINLAIFYSLSRIILAFFPVWLALIILNYFIIAAAQVGIALRYRRGRIPVTAVPALYVASFSLAIIESRKQVMLWCGAVVLLLVLSLAGRYLIDPFLVSFLSALPAAPGS